ncbi:MAG: HdeD family acid-resistance protein [Oscillospiraceae bacterium]
MNKLKSKKAAGIITAVCEAVVGVLLLIDPVGFTAGIITAFGILLIVLGAFQIIGYFRSSPDDGVKSQGMSKGLLEIFAGLFCALRAKWFILTFPVLTILYGVATLAAGATKVEIMVDQIRLKRKKWIWSGVGSLVTILCAVIILLDPFTSTSVMWIFVAVALIVEAFVDVLSLCLSGKSADED